MSQKPALRSGLRTFVERFPPLRVALCLDRAFKQALVAIVGFVGKLLTFIFKSSYKAVQRCFRALGRYLGRNEGAKYSKLADQKQRLHTEPIPWGEEPWKRALTYQGGLVLGALLYLFVYYVLVKQHSYTTISVAALLMLAYMIVLENSHSIRSILMLCLPIMFTNRGRALVFCCMISIMLAGPMKNSQANISALHTSLSCCKQHLILEADQYAEENVVEGIVKIEQFVTRLVDDIRQFVEQIQRQFRVVIDLALTVERYLVVAIQRLKDMIDLCNRNSGNAYDNCNRSFMLAYEDCLGKLGPRLDFLCELVPPVQHICRARQLPGAVCDLPRQVVQFIDDTVGRRLRHYMYIIQNELFVHIGVEHSYNYSRTSSKPFGQVASEIKLDMEMKFWYARVLARLFNLLSLILVCWIIITATLYHLHYLRDLKYDNMYLDGAIRSIDEHKHGSRRRSTRRAPQRSNSLQNLLQDSMDIEQELNTGLVLTGSGSVVNDEFPEVQTGRGRLLPLAPELEKKYLKPCSLRMNEEEMHKLYIAGLIWVVISGYVGFFVLLDYSLYELILTLNDVLSEIFFQADIPLLDVSSGSGDNLVHLNRTHLRVLNRKRASNHTLQSLGLFNNHTNQTNNRTSSGSLSDIYRRFMDSIEKDIPDDVLILDSLRGCLPRPSRPEFGQYTTLFYLGLITFCAVIVEAYALRTRHCIANLFYPRRAKQRAVWLYTKMSGEGSRLD